MTELPDWLRGVALLGKYGGAYLPVATDESGQLYIVLTGAPEITIPGTVSMIDTNTLKQIQGTDGTTFRTAKLNANGEFIIVPRGASGNYLAVDASGFMTTIMKALGPGAALTTIAADASGQLITILKGASGVNVAVDASGFLSAILKGDKGGGVLANVAVDASGQLIMVPRGASGNYMNVDASGFLSAIMKGQYGGSLMTLMTDPGGALVANIYDFTTGHHATIDASGFLTCILKGNFSGALKTVALDIDGRMIGIIPDLGGNFGNIDYVGLGEMAARLGSAQRWDTRGRILRSTAFDDGMLGQCTVVPVSPATCVNSPDRFESGGYAAKIYIPAAPGGYVTLTLESASGTSLAIGLEASFSFLGANFSFELQIHRYVGGVYWTGALKYDALTGAFYYFNSGASYSAMPGATFPVFVPTNFNHMKIVVNFGTGKYVRALLGEYEYDLSAYALHQVASSAANEIVATCYVYQSALAISTVWVDNLILTHAEP